MIKDSIPELIFFKTDLNDLVDAEERLTAFLSLVADHKVIKLDFSRVDMLTTAYADHFFSAAAVECITRKAKMNLFFKNKNESKQVVQVVQHALEKSLPISIGGSATLH